MWLCDGPGVVVRVVGTKTLSSAASDAHKRRSAKAGVTPRAPSNALPVSDLNEAKARRLAFAAPRRPSGAHVGTFARGWQAGHRAERSSTHLSAMFGPAQAPHQVAASRASAC